MLPGLKKEGNNVSVGVRVRPRNEKEIQAGMPVFFQKSFDGSSVEELDENGVVMKHWPYDYVFGDQSTNEEIFSSVGMKLVDAALDGYNTVIFLYGQTSSGRKSIHMFLFSLQITIMYYLTLWRGKLNR